MKQDYTIADPTAPCPCGSERPGRDCCLDDQGAMSRVPPAVAPPKLVGPQQTDGCYASPLGGCSAKLSAEHYISDSVLRRMSEGGGQLEVSKFVWLPQGSSRTIAPSALKAKVLCASHNSALSPFDVIGERFCHLILQTGHPTREARTVAGLFNGEDLERWFLKVLCGVTAMEHASSGTPWRAPVPWLESLFKVRDPMPTECGLWINLGGCILFPSGSPSVAASPIDNPSGPDPLGLRFQFCGLELVLLLSRSVRSRYLPRGRLRPALLKVDSPGYPSVRIGVHYRYSPLGMSLRMMPVPASSGPRNSGAPDG